MNCRGICEFCKFKCSKIEFISHKESVEPKIENENINLPIVAEYELKEANEGFIDKIKRRLKK